MAACMAVIVFHSIHAKYKSEPALIFPHRQSCRECRRKDAEATAVCVALCVRRGYRVLKTYTHARGSADAENGGSDEEMIGTVTSCPSIQTVSEVLRSSRPHPRLALHAKFLKTCGT
eukprot:6211990-Pleurochrysis_carterae.AAC.3